jgi:ribosomal protein L37AE/L43A
MLDKMEISYWVAPDMIPAGSNYAREIPHAIKECDIFLLVMSAASQDSIWVEKEIDSAINCRKTIVPFQIDDAPMNDMFRFYLNNVQIIHSVNRPQEAIRELKNRLRLLIPEKDKEMIIREKKSPQNHRHKTDAFTWNRIPDVCKYCGDSLKRISKGVYRCNCCGRDNYDDLKTVQRYLEKNGAKSVLVIERDTGVPRRVIEHFLEQEFLEIPKLETLRLSCQKCGSPIRSGTLCDKCKYGNRRIQTRSLGSRSSTGRQ